MKKRIFAAALTVALTLSLPAMASEPFITPARTPLTVEIEGENLDLTGKYPYLENEVFMVPVRPVAEALGYTVTWSAEYPDEIKLDNGTVKTTVTIGEDLYFMASSAAIGMSKPSPLGAAPVAADRVTYVPMGLFTLLGNGATTKDNVISFTKEDNAMTQMPNPMKKYDRIEDTLGVLGYKELWVPASLATCSEQTVYVIGGNLFELRCRIGEDSISYRVAEGDKDISGDYTVYSEVKTETIGKFSVTTKGNDGTITVATWTVDGYSYSLRSERGMSLESLNTILGN